MLADEYPLGNVDGTATANLELRFHGCLLASCPARHSVTPRCQLALLSFSRLNLQAYGLGGYGFSHPKIEMSKDGRSSLDGAQFGTKYRDCMGKTDRPLCVTNFITLMLSHIVRMEEYRCYIGTTPRRRCTHVHTSAKDKLRPLLLTPPFAEGLNPGCLLL